MNILKYISACLLGLVLATSLWSCNDNDSPQPPIHSDRTVLVYMVAANSLGRWEDDKLDLEEMRVAARRGDLKSSRWLVYHSTYQDSRLYELVDTGFVELKKYAAETSVSIKRMQNVIEDTRAVAPANGYGMIFWSHSTGWIEDGMAEENVNLPLSFGQDFSVDGEKRMNLTSLRAALEPYDFDYLYFDCCLMGSIEVCYELRNCARFIVASPTEVPSNGMPYDQNLTWLCDGSRLALIQAATNTFNYYNEHQDEYMRSIAISVIDTEALDALASAIADIYSRTQLPHPLSEVTNYYGSDTSTQAFYLDFGEYVDALCDLHQLDSSFLQKYHNAMSQAIIYKASTPGMWYRWGSYEFVIYNNSGLSTRVFNKPIDFDIKGYDRLQWANDVVTQHPEFHP